MNMKIRNLALVITSITAVVLMVLCSVQLHTIKTLNKENRDLYSTLQVKCNYEYSLNNNYEKLLTEYESISQGR